MVDEWVNVADLLVIVMSSAINHVILRSNVVSDCDLNIR